MTDKSPEELMEDIDYLSHLSAGWLDGDGEPVSQAVREKAKAIVYQPGLPVFYTISPTPDGGIFLEYERNGWDCGIEVNPDLSVDVFGIEINGPGEFYIEHTATGITEKLKENQFSSLLHK